MRVPPRPSLVSRWPALGACALSAGCHVFAGGAAGAGPGLGPGGGSSRVERREASHHPPINLLVRMGDPRPAVAFASAHDSGGVASVALSALLLARLRARGVQDVVSLPTQTGFELSTLCSDARAASAFMTQVTAALSAPLAEADRALPEIQEHLAALASRPMAGRGEAAVALCSGDLGQLPGAALLDVRTAAGRAQLEAYRVFAFGARASAFSAIGPREFVDAAAGALSDVPDWPEGEAPVDAWPNADAVDVDAADGPRRLSVALRVGDATAALSALTSLTAKDAALSSRLRSFLPGFKIERAAFQARPRGACVRVDLRLPEGDPAPSLREAAEAASIVSEELRAAFTPSSTALDENIVEPTDPRRAAARAAWRAVTGRQEPGSERRFVALAVPASERPAFAGLATALNDFETRPSRAPLEARVQAEAGQGELWLLLGSPCGTLGESNDDAGQTALALTLAAHASTDDVTLEPWLTSDAVGLLAHAPRRPAEGPMQQAERIARGLGRALTERDASGDALATAQGELLTAIGRSPRPAFVRLLDALSPEHSAWLEPRGSFTSLSQANRESVAARGRDLLRGPLRVAALANQDDAQAIAATHALERWLAPWRADPRRCQATTERVSHSGEISLSVGGDTNAESSYVGIPFASRLKNEREAQAIAASLNRAMVGALSAERLDASARASIVGGGRIAALIIEIHASEDDARRATLEVRRALQRVLDSPLSNEELVEAQRVSEQRALGASLDPRRRIVDLWRGMPADIPLSRNSVRAFQATLGGSAQVVVSVTRRD